jgi:allophanate hydrolase subunit 1
MSDTQMVYNILTSFGWLIFFFGFVLGIVFNRFINSLDRRPHK